jgi:hypothetical protein
VLWTEGGAEQEGVYIPRRDSGSVLNHWVGGRLFPGEHHLADFRVDDDGETVVFSMRSRDGKVAVSLRGRSGEQLPATSNFKSLQEASRFFERGALGYSETAKGDRLEGLRLVTKSWRVQPLTLTEVYSSYFSDRALFPSGTIEVDCALIMRDIEQEWALAPNIDYRKAV